MKAFTTIVLLPFLSVLGLYGQLNSSHNHFRAGDVLVKQQVEFVDPGQSGKNLVWDFSKLKTINDAYTLTYSLPPMEGDSAYIFCGQRYLKNKVSDNELIVGSEHNTMYYYHLTHDSLIQVGHENPVVRLVYTTPFTNMRFPLNYGQSTATEYQSQGKYSGTIDLASEGTVITSADAFGKMILPTGDTLSPVLRVKTVQIIKDIPNKYSLNKEGNVTRLETYRWYTKGYRYPIFETVRSINEKDESEIFSTAFYFPPQDHLYIESDPENLALLEELWDMENKENESLSQTQGKTVNVSDIMSCRMYPNPVSSILNLEYELKEDAKVSFEIYSLNGMPMKKTTAKAQKAGTKYYETLDCSGLQPKNYILRITANNAILNEVIIKE